MLARSRSIPLAGLGAALISNYWLLEWWLSERTDTPRSWISDLATRTEATGWRFQLLSILAGLAISAFAVLLLRRRAEGTMLRRGLTALLCVGAFATVAGVAPLSCPEGIEPSCTLAEDPGDVIHALATGGEILATILAFLLVGLAQLGCRGSWRIPRLTSTTHRGVGQVTLGVGLVWVVLTAATALAYLSGDVDAVKGVLQRASQVLFGTWLALLGWWFAQEPAAPE
jgi:Protein of unknown function (DUF998)